MNLLLVVLQMVILMSLDELPPAIEHVSTLSASDAGETRRRPGRLKKVNPDLIPLLRSTATADIYEPALGKVDTQFVEDNLAPVKGIVFAVALSVPLWAGIGALVWVAIR